MTTAPSSLHRSLSSQAQVGGVVVTFHPDEAFERRLDALVREVDCLIIVDNTATPEMAARLTAASTARGVHLELQRENVGLGTALNRGFAWLAERGCTWALAFDQDSTPQPGFRAALLALGDEATAVVGANWHDAAHPDRPARHLGAEGFGPFFRRRAARQDLLGVLCVITSGSLFQIGAWRELGGFDERLFLDLVDTDYCLRACAAGWAVRVAAGAQLQHHRGAKRGVRLAGATWWPAFMPPLRLFLLFRNRPLLIRRYASYFPHWVTFELVYATKIVAEILFLEDRKLSKLTACARGTWEGLFGRTGSPFSQP